MNKLNFTFLTEGKKFGICGDQLEILKKYGMKCAMTDFSILLGGRVSVEEHLKKERIGLWWTKTYLSQYDHMRIVHYYGDGSLMYLSAHDIGSRPALLYSSISQSSTNKMVDEKGIIEVEYGEYPQDIVLEDLAGTLESAYLNGTINQTVKSYTTNSAKNSASITSFEARKHIEYEYNGKKYIRFVGDSSCIGSVLSNGTIVEEGKPYWIEVKPITWMIDEEANIALSKKIIFSGVGFSSSVRYDGDFENTLIYRFMNYVFAKDIIPSELTKKVESQSPETDENQQIEAKLQEYEQLRQELKKVRQERASLLAKENDLKARMWLAQIETKGKGQYVKQ